MLFFTRMTFLITIRDKGSDMTEIAIIFGGPSLEHDVSILTGLQAAHVLSRKGQEPVVLYWTESNDWFRIPSGLEASAFLEGVPAGARPVSLELGGREPGFYEARSFGRRDRIDISTAVLCCHGAPGEDGRLQGILDLAKIAHTGPNAACAAITMDKLSFGGMAESAGLPVLPRVNWNPSSPEPPFPPPYVIKPRFGGSSLGVASVGDLSTARHLAQTSEYLRRGAILERYQENVEDLYIAIRTYPELQLSSIERPRPRPDSNQPRDGGQIYDYRQKYLEQRGAESAASEIPAQLPDEVEKLIRMLAQEIAYLIRLTGVARLDFLYDGSELWVNELNSIPGALAFRLWNESGVGHYQLLSDMITEATEPRAAPWDIDPIDRDAPDRKSLTLEKASKISQKLT
jgi:D-alanine-D-alanine ligase